MFYIVQSPTNNVCKVHEDDLGNVPYGWQIFDNFNATKFYKRSTGFLSKRYHAVKRLRTKEEFIEFEKKRIKSIDLLFGYFDNL